MDYIYSHAKNRRSGSAMQKMPLRGTLSRREAVRIVQSGYPRTERFKSREELVAYLSGDRITCLLCGNAFRFLAPHIKRTHGIPSETYKAQFGIPQNIGLGANDYIAAKAAHGKANQHHLADARANGLCRRLGRRQHNPPAFVVVENADRFRAQAGRLTYTDFSWHLDVMVRIWKYRRIKPPLGQASWDGFKKRWLKDKELRKQVIAARNKRGWRLNA